MKISKDFVLRKVIGENIVLPIGHATLQFNGMIRINDTGEFLWNHMQQNVTQEELAQRLTEAYNVSLDQATLDVNEFITILESIGCIENG